MKEKKKLRQSILARRDELDSGEVERLSARIRERFFHLEEISRSRVFFVYVSFRGEVDTHRLIADLWDRTKVVTVPFLTRPGEMEAWKIDRWDDLARGKYGILSPVQGEIWTGSVDICVAPGLAFTEDGDRLGFGQGNYDRYLSKRRPRQVVALAYEWQIVERLPRSETDLPVDLIITEDRVIERTS